MKKLYLLTMLFSTAYGFDPYEMPFGVYCTRDYMILDDIDIMDDTLGINFIYGSFSDNIVGSISQAGYDVIKWGSADEYNPNKMSGYSYFKVEAEDVASPIRFETQVGNFSGDFLVSSNQDIMLDDLWFKQYRAMYGGGQEPKQLYAKVRLGIDTAGVDLNDTIGRILVHRQESDGSWVERANIVITATDDLLAGDTVEVPANPSFFRLCEPGSCSWGGYKVKYSFWNSGATTVYLDYFKSYDQRGLEIVESDAWDDEIAAAVTGGWRDYVDYWWLRDEPRYDHFMPFGKVRSLVNDTTGDLTSITAFLLTAVRDSWDATQEALALKSFLQLTGQDKIVINEYRYGGGYGAGHFVAYSGYYDSASSSGHRGLQSELEQTSCEILDVVSSEIEADTILKEFWISPQCFYQVKDSSWGETPPNTMYSWRPPTKSEFRLNVYLPLCYNARGAALWQYHWGQSSDPGSPYSFGFYISDTERNAAMWDVYANDINPYIKAIDSFYLGLDWERAFVYKNQIFSPPAGAFISSIAAFSNPCGGSIDETECNNPDLGWFHLGEFYDESDNPYVMIVNRACSQGPDDNSEAPSITATIRFNPTNLGIGDYVYVIDLASGTDSADWEGVPETTYTAKMPDGYIPFTTIFRAGEGRLFKIAQAPAPYLSGDINTNYVYQGKMKVTGDMAVPNDQTMRIKGPARFEFFRCDSLGTGDPGLTEFTVVGTLKASGTQADSVLFVSDTTFACGGGLPVHPASGDWTGIFIDQNAACTLSYCKVAYAEIGLETRNDSHTKISNSNFHENDISGVYCYKGYLNVRYARFKDNGSFGLDGLDADIDVYGSRFIDNQLYGIRISGHRTSDSTLVEYDTVTTPSIMHQNGYGIHVSNIDSVRIYKCRVRDYYQGGLYLSNSDALVQNCDFSANTYYGIYANNSSFPKIRQCRIDTLSVGVKTNGSRPNIGTVYPNDSGNCTFLSYGAGAYYIYHVYKPASPDTFFAQNNYYAGNPVPTKFFWSDYR
jgi:parallel beta-helix repeat protein